ncbi:MAG: alpha-mannosidase, partial [Planctomycetota bacterium]
VVAHLSWNFYNLAATVDEVRWPVDQHRQAAVHHETLIPIGYGDGGGGPNDAMCERARRIENLAGMPRARWGTIEGFFDRLAERRDDLPVWQGEMYMQGHRGVQTTQAELKRRFRVVERALQVREAAACVLGQTTDAATDHAWRRIVFAQFHDYIPGSSVPEVYEEHLPELATLAERVERDTQEVLAAAEGGSSAEPCWFNPLPVPQTV